MSAIQQPPCLEEFVAAGYRAENYEKHFEELRKLGEEWGPTFSNPNWKPKPRSDELVQSLPDYLMVHSTVRNPQTRIARKQSPGRKPFKQHVFADPHKRLIRGRPVRITRDELVERFDTLHAAERSGVLAVHTVDGKRLSLALLRDGILEMSTKVPALTIPNPPLDSAANDLPHGIPVAQYPEGTFVGDPAAERVVQRMTEEKVDEGARQGALPSDGAEDPISDEDFDPAGAAEVVDDEEGDEPFEQPVVSPAPVADPVARPSKSKKHRR